MIQRQWHKMYSAHNEGKSVVAERFIRTLKNKTIKYITWISKKMCIDYRITGYS